MESPSTEVQVQFTGTAKQVRIYRQMTALGLLGSMRGLHNDADLIHASLRGVVADTVEYRALRVIAHAVGGEASRAIEAMTALMGDNPDEDFPKVVMGMAMLLAGHPDGQFMVDNVLATSLDQPAREAALRVLPFVPSLRKRADQRAGGTAALRPV